LRRPPATAKWKRTAVVAGVVAALAAALIIFRWRNARFEWKIFFATLTAVDWRWLTAAIVLLLASYVVRALRWGVMLRPLRPHPSVWGLVSATLIGFTAVVLLGRAGELVRPYLIAAKERVPFSSQMAAWLLERILDLLMILVIFAVGLTQVPKVGLRMSPGLQWILQSGGYAVAAITAACLAFLFLFRNFAEPAQRRLLSALTFLPESSYQRIERAVQAFAQGMQSSRGSLGLLLGETLLVWAMIVGGYLLLFRSFTATAHFSFTDVIIFIGFVSFGSVVQIPGVGGGMQLAAVLVLTEIFGLPLESASGLAVLIWILTFVVVAPFGLALAFQEGLNWRKLKHLQEEARL
jgi:uncharacterized protein (TIRG00374 family)